MLVMSSISRALFLFFGGVRGSVPFPVGVFSLDGRVGDDKSGAAVESILRSVGCRCVQFEYIIGKCRAWSTERVSRFDVDAGEVKTRALRNGMTQTRTPRLLWPSAHRRSNLTEKKKEKGERRKETNYTPL